MPSHTDYEPGAVPYTYWLLRPKGSERVAGGVIDETLLNIFVNGRDLATLMCSPVDIDGLVIGFLYNEGVITSLDDVRLLQANATGSAVDVFLRAAAFAPPRRLILTSGCGGVSLREVIASMPPLESDLVITPQVLLDRMHDLNDSARLYQQVRGVHTSVLGTAHGLLVSAEDIGRHNSIDKLAGKALIAGLDTRGSILVTSGRVSSEAMGKARQMGVPIVASRTAPTSIAVSLAEAWQICVVGYLRENSMRVYTHGYRLGLSESDIQT